MTFWSILNIKNFAYFFSSCLFSRKKVNRLLARLFTIFVLMPFFCFTPPELHLFALQELCSFLFKPCDATMYYNVNMFLSPAVDGQGAAAAAAENSCCIGKRKDYITATQQQCFSEFYILFHGLYIHTYIEMEESLYTSLSVWKVCLNFSSTTFVVVVPKQQHNLRLVLHRDFKVCMYIARAEHQLHIPQNFYCTHLVVR